MSSIPGNFAPIADFEGYTGHFRTVNWAIRVAVPKTHSILGELTT